MKSKITLQDNNELREQILYLTLKLDQKDLAKWSLKIARHVLDLLEVDHSIDSKLHQVININELWQKDMAKTTEVKNASLKILKLAEKAPTLIYETAFKCLGHAIASGDIKEQAMIASDYATKFIELLSDDVNDVSIFITKERQWQLAALKEI